MGKLKLLKIVNFCLVILLIALLVLAYFFPVVLPFDKMWYVIIVFVYSIMLYFKYALFGSDNILWFAITISLLGVYMLLFNFNFIGMENIPLISIVPAISSIILFCIYKNELHLNLLVTTLITGLPGFLFSYKIVGIWWFVFIEVIANILALLLIKIIHRNYKKG